MFETLFSVNLNSRLDNVPTCQGCSLGALQNISSCTNMIDPFYFSSATVDILDLHSNLRLLSQGNAIIQFHMAPFQKLKTCIAAKLAFIQNCVK